MKHVITIYDESGKSIYTKASDDEQGKLLGEVESILSDKQFCDNIRNVLKSPTVRVVLETQCEACQRFEPVMDFIEFV